LIKQNDGKVPKPYIKAVADLETTMLETIEKQKVTPKKMNAINTRGLNAVRQKIRKNNKDYSKDIEAYRENEDEFMEEEVEEVKPSAKKAKKVDLSLGADAVEAADDDGFTMVGAGGRAVQYTPESILKHLRSIVEQRGRKNTDRMEHIRTLEKLFDVAINDYQRIRVLLTVISTRFDLTSGTGNQMPQEQWKL
jgi:translation initiation factor 3 subunit C